MKKDFKLTRRNMLKVGAALATIPVVAITGEAWAAQNAALRGALKYQDKPGKDGQKCSTCTHWVPGKTATAKGSCKIIPDDDEISPEGWCVGWVAAPKK
ncbi:MAG: high-potential iron-sulfur protein [Burkholderiales bacterium]|jgi:anaerobic selenocysteine-containing dehydrogenase